LSPTAWTGGAIVAKTGETTDATDAEPETATPVAISDFLTTTRA